MKNLLSLPDRFGEKLAANYPQLWRLRFDVVLVGLLALVLMALFFYFSTYEHTEYENQYEIKSRSIKDVEFILLTLSGFSALLLLLWSYLIINNFNIDTIAKFKNTPRITHFSVICLLYVIVSISCAVATKLKLPSHNSSLDLEGLMIISIFSIATVGVLVKLTVLANVWLALLSLMLAALSLFPFAIFAGIMRFRDESATILATTIPLLILHILLKKAIQRDIRTPISKMALMMSFWIWPILILSLTLAILGQNPQKLSFVFAAFMVVIPSLFVLEKLSALYIELDALPGK